MRIPNLSILLSMDSEATPAVAIPETSPFTSHKNTGTPASEKDSAIAFIVIVLPVPLAPAISPWRLLIFSGIFTRWPSARPIYICPSAYIIVPHPLYFISIFLLPYPVGISIEDIFYDFLKRFFPVICSTFRQNISVMATTSGRNTKFSVLSG